MDFIILSKPLNTANVQKFGSYEQFKKPDLKVYMSWFFNRKSHICRT